MTEVEALNNIANELDWLFWLIFWFGLFGVFQANVKIGAK